MATVDEAGPGGLEAVPTDDAVKLSWMAQEPELDVAPLKRKASFDSNSHPDDDPKRPRRESSGRGSSTDRRPSINDKPSASAGLPYEDREARREPRDPLLDERRRTVVQEEKKRSKRLFGGLLNTLSQTTSNPQQKRRREIEQRQQERLKKQRVEDDQKRAEKLASLHKVRLAEQIVFEEQVMKNSHSKKLHLAGYLRTKTKPHIYYMPWKLTPEQEDTIDDQIRDAKDLIKQETADFEQRKEEHNKRHGANRQHQETPSAQLPGKADDQQPPEKKVLDEEPKLQPKLETVDPPAEAPPGAERDVHDESGDLVVEGDEDMVIY